MPTGFGWNEYKTEIALVGRGQDQLVAPEGLARAPGFSVSGWDGHDGTDLGCRWIQRLGIDALDCVSASEQPGEAAIAFCDQKGADATVMHEFASLADGWADLKGNRIFRRMIPRSSRMVS